MTAARDNKNPETGFNLKRGRFLHAGASAPLVEMTSGAPAAPAGMTRKRAEYYRFTKFTSSSRGVFARSVVISLSMRAVWPSGPSTRRQEAVRVK